MRAGETHRRAAAPTPRPSAGRAPSPRRAGPARARPIHVQNRHANLKLRAPEVRRLLNVLEHYRGQLRRGAPEPSVLERENGGEALSVAFLNDEELAAVHGRFLEDPSATDVITFPAEPGFGVAGEICVSVDAAWRQARPGWTFAEELALYVVHGWLHLLGHDDLDAAAKRRMRRAEKTAMRLLRRAGALPAFRR
jgi:probable rRNA maturation factor